jgi:hypothetical protein
MKMKTRVPAIPISPEVLNELKAQAKTRRYMKPYLEHLFVPKEARMRQEVRARCRKPRSKS